MDVDDRRVTGFDFDRLHDKLKDVLSAKGLEDRFSIVFEHENFDVDAAVEELEKEVKDFIEPEFKDLKKYIDASGVNKLYGFFLSGVGAPPPTIGFHCNFFPEFAEVVVTGGSYDPTTGAITGVNGPVSVQLVSKIDGSNFGEPYRLDLYPASCLGPHESTEDEQRALHGASLGGTGTCCNTQPILDAVETNTPRAFLGGDVLYDDGREAINTEMLFCFDPDTPDNYFGGYKWTYDYTNNILWEDFGETVTSLYEARVISTCKGVSPNPLAGGNLDPINSGSDLQTTAKFFRFEGFEVEGESTAIGAKFYKKAGRCEFCNVEEYSSLSILDDNGLVYRTGFKETQSNSGLTPIPNTAEFDSAYVLCDKNWWGMSEGRVPWQSGSFTPQASTGYRSWGYCSQGASTCKKYWKKSGNGFSLSGNANNPVGFNGNSLYRN